MIPTKNNVKPPILQSPKTSKDTSGQNNSAKTNQNQVHSSLSVPLAGTEKNQVVHSPQHPVSGSPQHKVDQSAKKSTDSSKSKKEEENQEAIPSDSQKTLMPDKENAKLPGNTKMLVTDPYREKFLDTTNQTPDPIVLTDVKDLSSTEQGFVSRLFRRQNDAEKKALEEREATKTRISWEKAQEAKRAKEKKPSDGKPSKLTPPKPIKKNQIAPKLGRDGQLLPPRLTAQSSGSFEITMPARENNQVFKPKKEIIPQNFVTSAGKNLKLVEMDDISGVFDVEMLDKDNRVVETSYKKNILALNTVDTFEEDKEKDKQEYNKLVEFNIPNRAKMMTTLLESDFCTHNFNGLIRQYYSYVLRSYCLMNMQDRYRGLSKSDPSLSVIDITKLSTEYTDQMRRRDRALKCRQENLEALRTAAKDSLHYRFLVEMTNNQPLTMPITIMHSILAETTPVVENVWRFYNSHLGKNHECTREAGFHFVRLERRFEMYDHLGLGNQNISDY